MHPFHRTELLVGGEGFDRLVAARVAVIGLGGVGGHAAEALARSGVGGLALVDFDKVCVTNVNRQIHATRKTVGKPKAELMAERIAAINPKCTVTGITRFFEAETEDELLGPPEGPQRFDVVLDCIDNMTAKIHLLESCVRRKIPVISAMGAGGRMDPTRVRVSDVSETHTDPFAKIVRDLLRQRGIVEGVECVWTDEPPNDLDAEAKASFRCICPGKDENTKHSCERRFQVQGTVAWMPGIFGMTMAAVAVGRLLGRPVAHRADRPRQRKPPPQHAAS
jgi:tRNA A37 threonylcarbamoyladenosine dehydratase